MPDVSEKSIFLNALEHDSSESRDQYLRSVCGDDAALRASIDELISAHERSENPLDHPVQPADCLDPTTAGSQPDRDHDVGKVIGPFTLMEKIGEGGFGLVFVAKQEKPVRRSVALKIIKPGTGSAEVLARFDAERQAVALMDHPNIAQIFDAGVTDDSRPYFVMELVRGIPITQFCDQRGLNLREKLTLFQDVCAATHHAHQKGVIHRDLKPSNVLVTLHDTKAVAKIIDFGVAKAMGQNLTDQTIYTRLFSMVGTPLYMSPEQASMSGLDVDTRSDIYSLGVLLYELLTGTTPFDRKRLDTVGYDEMRRIIREEEPPKPSTRLTTIDKRDQQTAGASMDGQTFIDQAKESGSASVRDAIPNDLDWIVMKAMEKDRSRRYESAAAMASDLRRFLAQEPIEARPPSQAYRLSKFARRNRVALISGALITLALVAGTAASLFQASQAIKERNLKDLALQKAIAATKEATEARRGVEEFADRLKNANALLGSERLYEEAQEYDAALDACDQAVALVPNYYLVWIRRAELLTKMRLWNDASADFAAALNLDAPVNGREWESVAALFVMTERMDDYRRLCTDLISSADDAPDALNWNAIRSCLVGPTDLVDSSLIADRAEEMLSLSPPARPRLSRGPRGPERDGRFEGRFPPSGRGGPDGRFGPDRWDEPDGRGPQGPGPDGRGGAGGRDGFGGPDGRGGPGGRDRFGGPDGRGGPGGRDGFGGPDGRGGPGGRDGMGGPGSREEFLPPHVQSYLAGWACLRSNRLEQAMKHLENASREDRWEAVGLVHPLIAMVHHAAGRDEMAQTALQRSHDTVEKMTDELKDPEKSPKHWIDYFEALVLHREATLKISGRAPVIDAKVFALEQAAKASLRGDGP